LTVFRLPGGLALGGGIAFTVSVALALSLVGSQSSGGRATAVSLVRAQPLGEPPGGRSAFSCSLFAAPNGSDAAQGTEADPFRTAQRLADALSAGQTGCLRGGTYETSREHVLEFPRGGSPGALINLQSYPGERARLRGIVVVPTGSSYIRLADLDIEGTGTMNTVKVYATDVTIEGNEITNLRRGRSCLLIGSPSAGEGVRTVVRRNVFHDCGTASNGSMDHGIYASDVVGANIIENVFYNSRGYAIQLYPYARDTLVAHNVIDGGNGDSIRGGIVIGGDTRRASQGNTVEHNIVAYARTDNISSVWEGSVGGGNAVKENCVWRAKNDNIAPQMSGFSASGNLAADPGFVDRDRYDYRLASSSPCLTVVGFDTAALVTRGSTLPDPSLIPYDEGRPAILSAQRGEGSRRRTVLVRARDKLSGVVALQLARDRRHPDVSRPLPAEYRGRHRVRQRLRYVPSGRRLYVRAIDRAGNSSRWRHVAGT
jgi:hypothetical protein